MVFTRFAPLAWRLPASLASIARITGLQVFSPDTADASQKFLEQVFHKLLWIIGCRDRHGTNASDTTAPGWLPPVSMGLGMTLFFGLSRFALPGALGLAFFFHKVTGSKWLFALLSVAFVVVRGEPCDRRGPSSIVRDRDHRLLGRLTRRSATWLAF